MLIVMNYLNPYLMMMSLKGKDTCPYLFLLNDIFLEDTEMYTSIREAIAELNENCKDCGQVDDCPTCAVSILENLVYCEHCDIYYKIGGYRDEDKGHPFCPMCDSIQREQHLFSILTPEQKKEFSCLYEDNHDDLFYGHE